MCLLHYCNPSRHSLALGLVQEFTDANSPKQNSVVERALGIVRNAALAACIKVPIIFPIVQVPPTGSPWAEAVHWSCDVLNHTATTVNPSNKFRMRRGTILPHLPHLTHSFAQSTAVGAARSNRHPGTRAMCSSGRASTTQVALCGCSRGQARQWRFETCRGRQRLTWDGRYPSCRRFQNREGRRD